MAVVVRRATKEDASTIADYALKLFAQHRLYDVVRFADLSDIEGAAWWYGGRAEAESAAVFVAELDGKMVGFAYCEYESIDYAALLENAVWLHDIYVDEAAREHCAGKALIDAAIELAQQHIQALLHEYKDQQSQKQSRCRIRQIFPTCFFEAAHCPENHRFQFAFGISKKSYERG